MTYDELYLARILFVNRLLRSNGANFQALFWRVMRLKHGDDFIEVRPQGRKGDGGNDGFLKSLGHYYQVYGPIDPEAKVVEAANKLATDFKTLLAKWNQTIPIRKFIFVFNDKYEGAFFDVAQAISKLEKANRGIQCSLLTCGMLEDEFVSLDPKKLTHVLESPLPSIRSHGRVDYSALREVITYIMSAPNTGAPTRFGEIPQLEDKISLNNLCTAWAEILKGSSRHVGHVDKYFSSNSTFAKRALRNRLVDVYADVKRGMSQRTLSHQVGLEDLVFSELRHVLLPPHASMAEQHALDILIAYYFEACDIFDPYASKETPNASPR